MTFIFEQIKTGGDRNFGYLIGDRESQSSIVIDPSYRPELFVERAKAQGVNIQAIFNTHLHSDHTNGNTAVQKQTGAKIFQFGKDLEEGSVINVGRYDIQVLHTPGHTEDHVVFYEPKYQLAFTGDHLFVGKIGGTSSEAAAKQQHESLQRLLTELPETSTVWPGHDVGCRPSSTLYLESKTNPFLVAESLDAFLEMKEKWADYKKEMGLK